MISVPPGTEMFQFPGLAPESLRFQVIGVTTDGVTPFGHPGITASVQLPQAYRSLARPSSPLDAKASTVCLIAFDLKILGFVTPTSIPRLSKSSNVSGSAKSAGDF